MMLRRWLLGSVAIAVVASGLLARPGVVTHRDGNTYTGEVSEDEAGKVTVKVRGIPMAIDRRDVVSIRYIDPAEEDFPKKLAALPANDIKGRMDLAKWALTERKYDWAIQAAESALKVDPNNREATDFITMARRQRELDRTHPAGTNPPAGNGTVRTTPPPATTPAAAQHKTLTPDDINFIRQSELRGNEDFRVQFNNDVRKRYVDHQKLNLSQFSSRPAAEQARDILKAMPELRNDVRITSDPASIVAFKRTIQPVIMQGCASAGCHSGSTGGGFVLLENPTSDPVAYTNFYILNSYVKQVEQRKIGMIERTTPQQSLLLQYGLPAENADPKHPAVPGYRGIYRTPADARFQLVARWLGDTLAVPAPDYSAIKYEAPRNEPAPPTTAPSK
jgi:hypothetical protein